jgi:hypothetical protein
MDVELLLTPHCPNAAAARTVLTACLRRLDLDLRVRERVGDYASPTILVDGVDVMTACGGTPTGQACRLDLPTADRVLVALRARATSSMPGSAVMVMERGVTDRPLTSALTSG